MLEEEEIEVPIVVSKSDSPNDSIPSENDVKMEDAKIPTDAPSSGAESNAPDVEGKPVQMETDLKTVVSKKKVKKTNVPFSEKVYDALSAADLGIAKEDEYKMAFQDRVMEETKDKKNAVEAYVYDMRNKLHDIYNDFVMDNERTQFSSKLQQVEDWLYEDGEDETKGVYIAKLEELKKQGDPIELRHKESMERGPALDQLKYCINSYREAAMSDNPMFDHIDSAEKEKVLNECALAEAWLNDKMQQQTSLPKTSPPSLLSADTRKKAEALDRFSKPIMTKPKPAPPKPQTPPPTEATPPSPSQPTTDQEPPAETDKNMEAAVPMETDKQDA